MHPKVSPILPNLNVFFSCVARSPLTCGTDYEEHFSQPIATLANGFLTFIPGT